MCKERDTRQTKTTKIGTPRIKVISQYVKEGYFKSSQSNKPVVFVSLNKSFVLHRKINIVVVFQKNLQI